MRVISTIEFLRKIRKAPREPVVDILPNWQLKLSVLNVDESATEQFLSPPQHEMSKIEFVEFLGKVDFMFGNRRLARAYFEDELDWKEARHAKTDRGRIRGKDQ